MSTFSPEKQNQIKKVAGLKEILSVVETKVTYPSFFLTFFIMNRTLILFRIIMCSAKSLLLLASFATREMDMQIFGWGFQENSLKNTNSAGGFWLFFVLFFFYLCPSFSSFGKAM